jgi:hypothetical protein
MRKLTALLALALLPLAPWQAAAQEPQLPAGIPARASAPSSRNQLALEVGILSAGLTYARRLGDGPLSLGGGAWGAWEPPGSFDRNVWEPLGAVAFARYRPMPWAHADVGVTAARYLWADDCSDCSGTLVGVRSVVLIGPRIFSVGPELLVGRASDERNGSELGVLWGVQARLTVGWEG